MSLRFATAAGLLGWEIIAAGSGIAATGTSEEVQLAQAQAPVQTPVQAPVQPQNIEASISSLHQRLQITPAQEAQFGAVANVMRENARAEATVPQQPPANGTAVDDLRAYIRYSEVELAGLKKMLPALEALYATLSPTQKNAANAAFRQGPGG
jgi:hypothetical protein